MLRAASRALGSAFGPRPGGRRSPARPPAGDYPGDFLGVVRPVYSPHLDGRPDPGEVVWTWVPFEEDHTQGKDRPVLLVGRDGPWLLGLQLTSKDHDRGAAREDRYGRIWMDLGSGPWDSQGRTSEVRLDRVVRVDPAKVRREGAVLDNKRFHSVVTAMHRAR
nr:type II toxin-antitoxin system PemK/MazF family toxin [Isoptericola halotolerans]